MKLATRIGLPFAMLALPLMAMADDKGLAELLGRIRQTGAAEFRYEETRTLELASSPVKATGYLLSSPDGSLVKLQLSPRRIIMAISGGQMLYYDQEQKQRHTASMDFAGQARQQITVFRALLQGRTEELKTVYDFSMERRDKRWKLGFKAKPGQAEEDAPSLEIEGDDNGHRRQMLIRQADGESSRYSIEKTGEGQPVEYSIQRLLLEAAGE
jgi:choline dehydrogenase-like flavoprotein